MSIAQDMLDEHQGRYNDEDIFWIVQESMYCECIKTRPCTEVIEFFDGSELVFTKDGIEVRVY